MREATRALSEAASLMASSRASSSSRQRSSRLCEGVECGAVAEAHGAAASSAAAGEAAEGGAETRGEVNGSRRHVVSIAAQPQSCQFERSAAFMFCMHPLSPRQPPSN